MFVRCSEVSVFCSIQRDSCVTGEIAMSASLVGNGIASFLLRTNVSRVGPELSPASTGFQRVAGAMCGSSAIFRGPTRRSGGGAIDCRQLAAAISRSAALIVTCASFSASANVRRDTAGPDTGAVPKVGGAPGGGAETVAPCGSPRHATAAPSTPSGAVIRNCLRVFMSQPEDVDQQTASGPPHRRRGRTLLRGAACHIPARRRMPKIADNSDSPSNQRFARVLMYAFTTSYTYSWHASPVLGS